MTLPPNVRLTPEPRRADQVVSLSLTAAEARALLEELRDPVPGHELPVTGALRVLLADVLDEPEAD